MCVDAEEWTQESGKGSPSVPKRRWLSIQSQKKKKRKRRRGPIPPCPFPVHVPHYTPSSRLNEGRGWGWAGPALPLCDAGSPRAPLSPDLSLPSPLELWVL